MSDSPIDREIRQRATWCVLTSLILQASEIIAFIPIKLFGVLAYLWLLFSWILPWGVWQINRGKNSFIDESVKKALNFTISICLYLTILVPIWFYNIVTSISNALQNLDGDRPIPKSIGLSINSIIAHYGLYFISALLILHFCAIVFGSIQASRGNVYKYPLSIRFFR